MSPSVPHSSDLLKPQRARLDPPLPLLDPMGCSSNVLIMDNVMYQFNRLFSVSEWLPGSFLQKFQRIKIR